jgi:hypothetical protein
MDLSPVEMALPVLGDASDELVVKLAFDQLEYEKADSLLKAIGSLKGLRSLKLENTGHHEYDENIHEIMKLLGGLTHLHHLALVGFDM